MNRNKNRFSTLVFSCFLGIFAIGNAWATCGADQYTGWDNACHECSEVPDTSRDFRMSITYSVCGNGEFKCPNYAYKVKQYYTGAWTNHIGEYACYPCPPAISSNSHKETLQFITSYYNFISSSVHWRDGSTNTTERCTADIYWTDETGCKKHIVVRAQDKGANNGRCYNYTTETLPMMQSDALPMGDYYDAACVYSRQQTNINTLPAGYYADYDSSTTQPVCLQCPAGTYSIGGAGTLYNTTCTECPKIGGERNIGQTGGLYNAYDYSYWSSQFPTRQGSQWQFFGALWGDNPITSGTTTDHQTCTYGGSSGSDSKGQYMSGGCSYTQASNTDYYIEFSFAYCNYNYFENWAQYQCNEVCTSECGSVCDMEYDGWVDTLVNGSNYGYTGGSWYYYKDGEDYITVAVPNLTLAQAIINGIADGYQGACLYNVIED